MHEFSLCEGIISQVCQQTKVPIDKIESVTIAVGELAGIDTELLQFWFPVVAKNKVPQNLKLIINTVPAQVICLNCQCQFHLKNLYSACPDCRQYANYRFLSGRELIVRSLCLKDED